MAIHVQCAGCGAKFQAPEKLAGTRVKCPKCSAAIVVGERPRQSSGQAAPAEEKRPLIPVACRCGKELRVQAGLAGKRVKCPACGQPLAVPALQPPAAQRADELDLERLAGAVADAAAMPSAPLAPLRKKKRPSNTRLIVGLSVGAGAAVLVRLLILLLWPSGNDKDLAKEGAAPGGKSKETVEIPAQPKKEYPWLEGSAPFDVAQFLAPIPEQENAAPLYLDALVEFDLNVLILLVSDKEKRESIWKERQPEHRKRNAQYVRFDEAWRKDPKSVNMAEVDAWLAAYETGFKKLAVAQQRPRCMFPCNVSFFSLSFDIMAARGSARAAIWRNRRDLQRGDFERPIQGIESVLRLNRDIRHRGDIICQLVSVAMDQMCCDHMVREVLPAPGLRREHCDRLLAVLARHEAEAIDPFLECQRVQYLRTRKLLYDFQHRTDIFDQQGYEEVTKDVRGSKGFLFPITSLAHIWQFGFSGDGHRLATEKYGNLRDLGSAKEGSGKSGENWRRLLAMTDEDHAKEVQAVNRVWAAILGLEGRTLRERQRILASGSLLNPLRETYVAVFFVPDSAGHQAFPVNEAKLRGTQCLVALRRWQLEQRQPPKDLQTVVKAAGMSGVPIDPYCDEPLRMTVLQGVPVIYSVGPDGKDDKAAVVWDFGRGQPGDYVFRLEAPTNR